MLRSLALVRPCLRLFPLIIFTVLSYYSLASASSSCCSHAQGILCEIHTECMGSLSPAVHARWSLVFRGELALIAGSIANDHLNNNNIYTNLQHRRYFVYPFAITYIFKFPTYNFCFIRAWGLRNTFSRTGPLGENLHVLLALRGYRLDYFISSDL